MKRSNLFSLCFDKKWPEVRKYVSSNAAEEEKKSNIMYRRDDYVWTCLHAACWSGAPDDIIKAMIDIGGKELVMMIDDEDQTVLHFACYSGVSYNIIKMLIEVGGKDLVMAKNEGGDTALHWLCWYTMTHTKVADAEKIKLFLQIGDANILLSIKNLLGKTPLEIATDKGASKKIKKLLTLQSTTTVADIMQRMEATHAQEVLDKFDELTLQSTTPVADMQLEDDNQYTRASSEVLESRRIVRANP
jgi:hypothetical protein